MRVRDATPADIPAMQALAAHAVTAAQWTDAHYHALFAADPRRITLVLEASSPEPTAQSPEHAAGSSALEAFLVARTGPEWELENIAVAGPARRRGHGTRLLGELLDRARASGAAAVYLEVRESNHAARALYEKWAFVESGRRPRYYRDPEEAAVIYRFAFVENSPPVVPR